MKTTVKDKLFERKVAELILVVFFTAMGISLINIDPNTVYISAGIGCFIGATIVLLDMLEIIKLR